MKVKNLTDYPQQLGDNRVIGVSGTKVDTREYDLEALAKEDKKRVKDGTLAVVEEVEAKKAETNPVETKQTVETLSEGETFLDSSDREKLPLATDDNVKRTFKGKSKTEVKNIV